MGVGSFQAMTLTPALNDPDLPPPHSKIRGDATADEKNCKRKNKETKNIVNDKMCRRKKARTRKCSDEKMRERKNEQTK